MSKANPFRKATKGVQRVKLLLAGYSGGGKTYTALALACHMAEALGDPGSVAVIDTEDKSARLYAYDDVLDQPVKCECDECRGGGIDLAFDHLELRDHSPESYLEMMRAACRNGYKALVIDSASHEWCGRNGCLEQVDALKGDGKKRKTDNAWAEVTPKHNAFLHGIRSAPINLIATARVKDGRDDSGIQIIQRSNDGTFDFEFTFYGVMSGGNLKMVKSRASYFRGKVYQRPGKFVAENLLRWGGQLAIAGAPPALSRREPEDGELSGATPEPEPAPEPTPEPAPQQEPQQEPDVSRTLAEELGADKAKPRPARNPLIELVEKIRSASEQLEGYRAAQAENWLQVAGTDEDKLRGLLDWVVRKVAEQPAHRDRLRAAAVAAGQVSSGEADETPIAELERLERVRETVAQA